VLLAAVPCAAQVANGFPLQDAAVPSREIVSGGVPRDGILALVDPQRWSGEQANRWLSEDDRVVGVLLYGSAVAYPLRVLNRHEIVNDVVGGKPIAVTYCPLCRSAIVFDGEIAGQRRILGVSGLLYQSDVLMFDRATDSLISQLLRKGITGPLKNVPLRVLPARHTTWERWYADHPTTAVLSRDVAAIDYGSDPYATYHHSGLTWFKVRNVDRSRKAKSFAYALTSADRTILVVELDLVEQADGEPLVFRLPDDSRASFDPEALELSVNRNRWRLIPAYWFALSAFFPDAERWGPTELEAAVLAATGGLEFSPPGG